MVPDAAVGRITTGIQTNTLVDQTVAFVRQQLPLWRDDPKRKEETAEDRLNVQLCKYLDACARDIFPMVCFFHEEFQAGQRRVDLSALPKESVVIDARQYTKYDPFLVIEGKRLPAPSHDRETEYVTGKHRRSGGMQRFKLGLHGGGLSTSILVGYVQAQSPQAWHHMINTWISDLAAGSSTDVCIWTPREMLKPLAGDGAICAAHCESTLIRLDESAIRLHHLWVVMGARPKDKS